MSWRLLLPALFLTTRHATPHTPLPPNHSASMTLTPLPLPLANNPATNPCASSYYYHPPPPTAAAFHWTNSDTLLTTILRTTILTLVHGFCALHQRFNTLHTHGLPSLQQLVLSRPPGTALLTISNHTSTLDDPYIITTLLPFHQLLSAQHARHSWCAADICFKHGWYGVWFRLGQIFPVQRGGGLYQAGTSEALSYLMDGGWVHVSRFINNAHSSSPERQQAGYDGQTLTHVRTFVAAV